MTDETTAQEIIDPAERAKANGYVEAPEPSREERVAIVLRDAEHAMNSNAPISHALLNELKALLS